MYPETVSAKILSSMEKRRISLRRSALEFFNRNPGLSYLKPVVRVLTLNTLRNYMLLDYVIESYTPVEHYRLPSYKKWLLRIIAYEVVIAGRYKRSRIEKTLSLHGYPYRVYTCLREADIESVKKKLSRIGRDDIVYSIPKHILGIFYKSRIPYLRELLETLLKDPITWIRVVDREYIDKAIEMLKREGYSVSRDNSLGDCLRLISGSRGGLRHTMAYRNGYIVVEDKASILVGHIVNSFGGRVLDITCGSGLKLSHILEDNNVVIGQDTSFDKLLDTLRLINRLCLNKYRVLLINTDSRRYIPRHYSPDTVLIDPPCSSLGRLALQPEIKLFLDKKILGYLKNLQYRLVYNVVNKLRRGTRIVYTTCTINTGENEDIIKWFEREGYIEVIKHKPFIGSRSPFDPRIQRLYPHIHGTQGFTIASMEIV